MGRRGRGTAQTQSCCLESPNSPHCLVWVSIPNTGERPAIYGAPCHPLDSQTVRGPATAWLAARHPTRHGDRARPAHRAPCRLHLAAGRSRDRGETRGHCLPPALPHAKMPRDIFVEKWLLETPGMPHHTTPFHDAHVTWRLVWLKLWSQSAWFQVLP